MTARLASAIVSLAARTVPRHYRARWREEWLGEIRTAAPGWPLLVRTLGAIPDALTSRRAIRDPHAAGSQPSGLLRGLAGDVRFGLRMLRTAPGASLAAVLSLAIGIGATTVAFGAINASLFRSIPGVRDADRLVKVSFGAPGLAQVASRPEDIAGYRAALPALSDVAIVNQAFLALGGLGEAVTVRTIFVSDNYFDLLGTEPAAGRLLGTSTAPVAAAVAGYTFVLQHFGAPSAALGRRVSVGGHTVEIVGVAPADFDGTRRPTDVGAEPETRPGLWLPIALQSQLWPEGGQMVVNRNGQWTTWIETIARLVPGTTLRTAQAQARRLQQNLGEPSTVSAVVRPFAHDRPAEVAVGISLILSVPLVVLAIGCANAANLQLARTAGRLPEIAVRLSLGASRARLVRQLLVESGLVAAFAAVAGLALAAIVVRLLASQMPVPTPIDWRVLAFTIAIAAVTGIGFGTAPALAATRGDLTTPLKDSAEGGGRRRSRLQSGLVIAQIALSLVLLVLAGLFIRTLHTVHDRDDGRLASVAVATVDLRLLRYTPERAQVFQSDLLALAEQLFGVRSAAIAAFGPSVGGSQLEYSLLDDRAPRPSSAHGGAVQGQFIETAGLRILRGRGFLDAERNGPPQVALVSDSLANRISPSGDALGRRLTVSDGPSPPADVEIVGVTSDVTHDIDSRDTDAIYLPAPLEPRLLFRLWVRTTGSPAAVLPAIRELIHQLDSGLPIRRLETADAELARETAPIRRTITGLGSLGFLALLLASGGLYAVMAHLVASRRHELAVRLALGAQSADLVALVVGAGLWLSTRGVVAGAVLAGGAASVARAAFVGVSPFDPIAFGSVAAILLVVALAACLVPAMRAARLDPLVSLRRT